MVIVKRHNLLIYKTQFVFSLAQNKRPNEQKYQNMQTCISMEHKKNIHGILMSIRNPAIHQFFNQTKQGISHLYLYEEPMYQFEKTRSIVFPSLMYLFNWVNVLVILVYFDCFKQNEDKLDYHLFILVY
jgi:hypothetical protein